ncbi:MAG: bifunctional D-glycero-beta-D-manno-heptose-7-phosphate kinase/D-glycero-beta-D-manno-heptose 1-phosphate adenylyltransferase HldE [Gammaproteobacteria bacterium]|nr:bifunctional D-glycero-beta-D-manno-heptose-7-phosphate kinase/D-glycero-beta-D-manno-heptose 1-phosphate adenylyltransferase HldE [Gammaproteobacteria bacterium]
MNLELQNFINARILVIGDVMLDRYLHGETSRISPEAPVPIVRIKNETEHLGGASNVALNAKAIGAKVSMLGVVGKDAAAVTLKQLLKSADIECQLQNSTAAPTITKTRVIAYHQQLIRLDHEEPPHALNYQKLLKIYHKQLANSDVVIISDYGKGIAQCAAEVIKAARARNIPVLIDPKGRDFAIYRGASVITPNLSEFEAIVGPCKDEAEIAERGLALLKEHDFGALLVTRGAHGMSLIRAAHKPVHIPTDVREVYDVTGAGDTVIATLGVALAAGEKLEQAMQVANIAAGITVRKLGAVAVSAAELRRALQKKRESLLGVANEKQLIQAVTDAKAEGEKVVMTNGCFDVLHPGHIAYLEEAKALGTRLIVAVNDDASVKRLKGSDRPINKLEHRMAVLAGLKAVDWVVAFSEDTPLCIIKAVTPDVLVKGGDWQTNAIVGADHVISHGGEVKSLAFIENHSSSAIINRIRGDKK